MYIYQHKIKLHETDAAGILFFSRQFQIIHDAYEVVLEKIGFGFPELLNNQSFFLPIVHAESDYKKPVYVGDLLEIEVRVKTLGKTSFSFEYAISNHKKELVGTAVTVHVTIDKKTKAKIAIPDLMREKIEVLLKDDSSS